MFSLAPTYKSDENLHIDEQIANQEEYLDALKQMKKEGIKPPVQKDPKPGDIMANYDRIIKEKEETMS